MSDDLVKWLRSIRSPFAGQAAARIEAQAAEIEAYRRSLYLKQTLISDQAAEIERLRELIKVTGDHWLELQHKHPIQWEGAIDAAMAAACAEIEKLRRDHASVVKEANIAKARLKGVEKQWHADRAALAGKAEQ